MKCDTRMQRYEFISQSFCNQLFRPNGFKYKIEYYLKKRSGAYWISRNACNFFCFNGSLSTEGTACWFYISRYSVTEINHLHDGFIAENTTEQVNWYFSSAVVSSWKGLIFIIRVFFPRYSVEIIVEKINICVLNTISRGNHRGRY